MMVHWWGLGLGVICRFFIPRVIFSWPMALVRAWVSVLRPPWVENICLVACLSRGVLGVRALVMAPRMKLPCCCSSW